MAKTSVNKYTHKSLPQGCLLFIKLITKVKIHLTPTNVDNKLREDSNINYIIMPLKSLDSSYIEGYGSRCMQSKIDNPYSTCGRNKRPEFPKICPVSQGKFSVSENHTKCRKYTL